MLINYCISGEIFSVYSCMFRLFLYSLRGPTTEFSFVSLLVLKMVNKLPYPASAIYLLASDGGAGNRRERGRPRLVRGAVTSLDLDCDLCMSV